MNVVKIANWWLTDYSMESDKLVELLQRREDLLERYIAAADCAFMFREGSTPAAEIESVLTYEKERLQEVEQEICRLIDR